jgi:hypothetical protein
MNAIQRCFAFDNTYFEIHSQDLENLLFIALLLSQLFTVADLERIGWVDRVTLLRLKEGSCRVQMQSLYIYFDVFVDS